MGTTKGSDGVWSTTIGPLTPEIWIYNFRVQGVELPDPSNISLMPRAERTLVHRSITGALVDGIACDVTIPFQTGPLTIKNLHITARPIRNANGNIDGLFGTVQDITRQKAAEENLHAREQLLRALYDNVPYRFTSYDSKSIAKVRPMSSVAGAFVMTGRGASVPAAVKRYGG